MCPTAAGRNAGAHPTRPNRRLAPGEGARRRFVSAVAGQLSSSHALTTRRTIAVINKARDLPGTSRTTLHNKHRFPRALDRLPAGLRRRGQRISGPKVSPITGRFDLHQPALTLEAVLLQHRLLDRPDSISSPHGGLIQRQHYRVIRVKGKQQVRVARKPACAPIRCQLPDRLYVFVPPAHSSLLQAVMLSRAPCERESGYHRDNSDLSSHPGYHLTSHLFVYSTT